MRDNWLHYKKHGGKREEIKDHCSSSRLNPESNLKRGICWFAPLEVSSPAERAVLCATHNSAPCDPARWWGHSRASPEKMLTCMHLMTTSLAHIYPPLFLPLQTSREAFSVSGRDQVSLPHMIIFACGRAAQAARESNAVFPHYIMQDVTAAAIS